MLLQGIRLNKIGTHTHACTYLASQNWFVQSLCKILFSEATQKLLHNTLHIVWRLITFLLDDHSVSEHTHPPPSTAMLLHVMTAPHTSQMDIRCYYIPPRAPSLLHSIHLPAEFWDRWWCSFCWAKGPLFCGGRNDKPSGNTVCTRTEHEIKLLIVRYASKIARTVCTAEIKSVL